MEAKAREEEEEAEEMEVEEEEGARLRIGGLVELAWEPARLAGLPTSEGVLRPAVSAGCAGGTVPAPTSDWAPGINWETSADTCLAMPELLMAAVELRDVAWESSCCCDFGGCCGDGCCRADARVDGRVPLGTWVAVTMPLGTVGADEVVPDKENLVICNVHTCITAAMTSKITNYSAQAIYVSCISAKCALVASYPE